MKNTDFYYIFFFQILLTLEYRIIITELQQSCSEAQICKCVVVTIYLTNSNVLNFRIPLCSPELAEVGRFCSCWAAFYQGLCYHTCLWRKDHVFWKTFYKLYYSFNLVSPLSFLQTSLLKQMHACFSHTWTGMKRN